MSVFFVLGVTAPGAIGFHEFWGNLRVIVFVVWEYYIF